MREAEEDGHRDRHKWSEDVIGGRFCDVEGRRKDITERTVSLAQREIDCREVKERTPGIDRAREINL